MLRVVQYLVLALLLWLPNGLAPLPFLEREYVWGVHGTDELLVQYDRQRVALWAIVDDGGDVVAACDFGGSGGDARVAAQFTFDAYGDVLTADHIYAHAHLRCGHKGLFVDRLDVGVVTSGGVEQPRLIPSAHTIVHNRNRTYIPSMARFAQADPNATAAVLSAWAHHGSTPQPGVDELDLGARFGDGGNLYEYLGSSPAMRSDPLGLFIFDAVGAYMDIGFTAGKIAFGLATVYSENLSWDVEWATDWSQGDDWHSRSDASWIQEVYRGAGIHEAVNGQLDPTGGLLMGGGSRQAVEMVSLLRHGRKLAGRFMQLHHILPRYFRYIIDKASDVGARIPSRLHHNYHQHVGKEMQRQLGCPAMNAGPRKWEQWIERRALELGGSIDAVRDEVKRSLQTFTDEWGGKNGISGLGDTLRNLLQ